MRQSLYRILVLLLLTGVVLELSEVIGLLTRLVEGFGA